MFYDIFQRICEDRGISPTRVLVALNISKGSLKNWKSGIEPRNETKKKIADYFNISVRELMSEEIEEAPTETSERNDEEMAELLEAVRRNPDLKVLFSLSKKASPEDVKKYIQMIKLMCGDEDGRNLY